MHASSIQEARMTFPKIEDTMSRYSGKDFNGVTAAMDVLYDSVIPPPIYIYIYKDYGRDALSEDVERQSKRWRLPLRRTF